jgi:hypothetical protein
MYLKLSFCIIRKLSDSLRDCVSVSIHNTGVILHIGHCLTKCLPNLQHVLGAGSTPVFR